MHKMAPRLRERRAERGRERERKKTITLQTYKVGGSYHYRFAFRLTFENTLVLKLSTGTY